jgi:hypothetical protein
MCVYPIPIHVYVNSSGICKAISIHNYYRYVPSESGIDLWWLVVDFLYNLW